MASTKLWAATILGIASTAPQADAQGASSAAAHRATTATPLASASSPATPDGARGVAAPASITIEGGARRMLVGATVPHVVRVRDATGAERRDVPVRWVSSDPNVAPVNQYGVLTAVRPGPVVIRAVAGSLSAERRYTVEANPIRSLTLSITADQPRTGDVVEVSATAFDASGYKVPNVPFLYTFTAAVEDSAAGQLAPAELDQQGRFVAQKAGDYQIIAVAPGLVAHRTVRVSNRGMNETPRLIGRVPLSGLFTAGVFAWHGRDGRDYLLACGATTRGQIVAFDITDAGAPRAIDTLGVDARLAADCVVDAESGVAAFIREGTNGRRTIALLDVSNPRALRPLGNADDALGSVSGLALYRRHILALSDGHRLDIISVEDPMRPRRVASIELADARDAAGAGDAADVRVDDGIAYVALGSRGVALVDVGNGRYGGSLAKPARIGAFRAPFASTHAAVGLRSRTGKWYVVTGERTMADADGARGVAGPAAGTSGFARIIDFTDPTRPEAVGRYEVPEAGVRDLWIDGERLYVAAERGGARAVDVSADLKGNLYYQGREITRFFPADGDGPALEVVAVQAAHRGILVVADRATGVWLVKGER